MSGLTLDAFLLSFPEFKGTSPSLVNAKLGEALLSIDASVWGPKANAGQGYLAAHLVTLSPTGQNARMIVSTKNGQQATTTYWGHYKRLQSELGGTGASVAGGGPTYTAPWSPWYAG